MYFRNASTDGIGKVFMTLTGAIGQISIRVVLSWLLFGDLQLSAVAFVTGKVAFLSYFAIYTP